MRIFAVIPISFYLALLSFTAQAEWTGDAQACAVPAQTGMQAESQIAIESCDLALTSGLLNRKEEALTLGNKASHLYARGDYATAVEAASLAIALEPAVAKHYNTRASAAVMLNEMDQAIADWHKALDLLEQSGEGALFKGTGTAFYAHYGLGWIYHGLGRSSDAEQHLRQAYEINPNAQDFYNLFGTYGLK